MRDVHQHVRQEPRPRYCHAYCRGSIYMKDHRVDWEVVEGLDMNMEWYDLNQQQ